MCTFISAIGRNFIDIGLDLNTVSEGLSRELTILVAYDGNKKNMIKMEDTTCIA